MRLRSNLLNQGMNRRELAPIVGVGAVVLLGVSLAPSHHPAHVGAMLAFHAAFVVLIALVPLRPRSHVYTALATMLTLGFWTKFLLRLVIAYPYLEPIGKFDASTPAWNHALATITAGVLGVVVARVIHLVIARARGEAAGNRPPAPTQAPTLYVRHHRAAWIATAIVACAAYAWNAYARVYVTGMDPRLVLPFNINAALSWWYLMGLPLWLALLIGWELARRGTRTMGLDLLWIPIVDGVVNAGSLLSRAAYLVRLTPYFLATTRADAGEALRIRGSRAAIGAIALAGFVVSLGFVMAMRAVLFHPPAPAPVTARPASAATPAVTPPAEPAAEYRRRSTFYAAREVGRLFLDRWTGMEGVLAVTAAQRTPDLLRAVIQEDPSAGVDSIYQRLAGAPYKRQAGLTFLTLAGPIALLALADSWVLVLCGMAIVAGLLIASEAFARRTLGNEILCSVMAVGACLVVTQVTFPRLLAIFLVELWMTLLLLAVLRRQLSSGPS
jgi:hypothetical protein